MQWYAQIPRDMDFLPQEPYTKKQAYIDLFMIANFKDSIAHIKNWQTINVKRGEIIWWMERLGVRWMRSKMKVKRFLDMLESVAKIELQKISGRNYKIILKEYVWCYENDTVNDTTNSTTNDTTNDTTDVTHKNNDNKEKKGKKGNSLEDYFESRNRISEFSKCKKITKDIRTVWNKKWKYRNKEDIILWTTNYLNDIRNRKKDTDYANHRFSLYKFLKQSNWLETFINQ